MRKKHRGALCGGGRLKQAWGGGIFPLALFSSSTTADCYHIDDGQLVGKYCIFESILVKLARFAVAVSLPLPPQTLFLTLLQTCLHHGIGNIDLQLCFHLSQKVEIDAKRNGNDNLSVMFKCICIFTKLSLTLLFFMLVQLLANQT